MPYLWTDTPTIQAFLDIDGTVQIGDPNTDPPEGNLSESSAEVFENQAVFEIRTLLAIAWEDSQTLNQANTPADIKRLAAQLAAGKIATVRFGTSAGEIPEWVKSYKNEVFAQLQRMIINYKSNTIFDNILTMRDNISATEILILVKTREQTVTQDV